jgi:uncharacterized RDD family membrane protein YckC
LDDIPAGLVRRLCALAYDAIVLFALCALVTLAFLPLNSGDAVTGIDTPLLEYFYRGALVAALAGYSCYCWTHGGQTIGMLAWRLRVVRETGGALDWPLALRRFAAACVSLGAAGLGLLWVPFDPARRAWHDRWTRTRVILLPKKPPRSEAAA